MDIKSYDYYIVAFSGGKDSTASFLELLEQGVDKSKIELWHHNIDGEEGSSLMDWNVTRDYCKKFAAAFDVPIYFSWKVGGFEGEMTRNNQLTAPTKFETPDGSIISVGGERGKLNTREKFPQVSADLKVRWCSAYLKIMIAATSLRNQERFLNKRVLFVTGERAEESKARAKYATFEPHTADTRNSTRVKRHIDHYRPIHAWLEQKVWDIIEKYKINPHPAYKLGWDRLSCMTCIFGNKDQWTSAFEVNPEKVEKIIKYEEKFGVTIKKGISVIDLVLSGTPYKMNDEVKRLANSKEFTGTIIRDDG